MDTQRHKPKLHDEPEDLTELRRRQRIILRLVRKLDRQLNGEHYGFSMVTQHRILWRWMVWVGVLMGAALGAVLNGWLGSHFGM